jgi:hypothetical protein
VAVGMWQWLWGCGCMAVVVDATVAGVFEWRETEHN